MTNIDNRRPYLSIYADLSKAFDCIDQKIMLSKLSHYGLEENAVALLNNYLSDRQQFVKIDNSASEKTSIRIGVPQGSILGPLLFTIYINDIARTLPLLQTILYADDSTFSLYLDMHEINQNINSVENTINNELDKISTWLKSNQIDFV